MSRAKLAALVAGPDPCPTPVGPFAARTSVVGVPNEVESWASSPGVRSRMQQQPSKNTNPELALRSELHRRGLRYRVHVPILDGRRKHDIVFTRAGVVVEVLGCFWHRCPRHGTSPRSNAEWWEAKLEGNVARDKRTAAELRKAGWKLIRVWEHEDPVKAADRVQRALE